jgi:lysophospholipase L1-like esterase
MPVIHINKHVKLQEHISNLDHKYQNSSNPWKYPDKTCVKRILIGLLLLLSLEVVFQTISYFQYVKSKYVFAHTNPRINNWFLREKINQWWIEESSKLKMSYHPFLGFITKNYHSDHINFDVGGIRKTDYNPAPDNSNLKTIYLFGGSTMAGNAVTDNETIPSYLAKILNNPAPRYQVVNYGQFGYNFDQELQFLLLQLKAGKKPDIVIFYDGCNDFFLNRLEKTDSPNLIFGENKKRLAIDDSLNGFDDGHPENNSLINARLIRSFLSAIFNYVKLIHYPMQIISRLVKNKPDYEMNKNYPDQKDIVELSVITVKTYHQNAQMIANLADEYKFRYLLFWQPLIFNKTPTDDEKPSMLAPTDYQLYNLITKQITSLTISNFIDLSNLFAKESSRSIYYDACHITPWGNNIVAQNMADSLSQLR